MEMDDDYKGKEILLKKSDFFYCSNLTFVIPTLSLSFRREEKSLIVFWRKEKSIFVISP
jgi:hypothetical protein